MAQRVQVTLVCDLHGDDETPGTETLFFALDGSGYEIDVCDTHAAEIRDAFAPFVGAARRGGAGSAPRPRRRTGGLGRRAAGGGSQPVADIRAWARANGHKVNDRGRIPAAVVAAYEAAH